jgi:uncharacterized membrane protein YdjX (TVP38/TMEM64 family)
MREESAPYNFQRLFFLLYVAFTVFAPWVFTSYLIWWLWNQQATLLAEPWWSHRWIWCLPIVQAFGLVNATTICFIAGYCWGWSAVMLVFVSYTGAALAGFWISKQIIDQKQLISFFSKQNAWKKLMQISSLSGFWVSVFARVSPIFPFATMNLILPALGVPFWSYVWGSLLGMAPRSLLAISLGITARSLACSFVEKNCHQNQTTYGVLVVFLLVSFAGFFWLWNQQKAKGMI